MYDGAVVAGDHLFVYVRQEDDSWWRIKRHEATKVNTFQLPPVITDRCRSNGQKSKVIVRVCTWTVDHIGCELKG